MSMKSFAFEEGDMSRVLMLMSHGQAEQVMPLPVAARGDRAPERVFVCKTCNRSFPSFQALGGHRASHKKPRLDGDGGDLSLGKPKLHGCSICGLEFAIGQALGGHMRRHRAITGGMPPATIVVDKKPEDVNVHDDGLKRGMWLDLNQPPCDDSSDTEAAECGHNATNGITFHQFLDTGAMAMDCLGY
ncbi:zinc finger protein ZAT12-like [Phragmites australis]|uniref:zinc finger protein ZAT12-like n=1 Tax=Phragmites australis TaxID=29695 RepID=UPI002D779E7E|nr:zinc finger protein ZAT12-like [Phragmites australis]